MKQLEKKIILGVDPGTNILGYAVIEADRKEIKLLVLGVVKLQHLEEQQHKLQHIFERLQEVITSYSPTQMGIEAPFFGKNPQSMLKLGRAQGVAIAAAITKGVDIVEYAPRKIKQAITGNGSASKEQVAAMLNTILNKKIESEYLDATDALAAAVCHYYQSKNDFGGGEKYNDWSAFVKNNPNKTVKLK